MYHIAKLVLKSYMPKRLEKGMLFLVRQNKQMVIYQMNVVPIDMDAYVQLNGYPVEPFIIREGNPNLNDMTILATPEEIAWWDEGDHSDEYRDLSTVELNFLIEYQDSLVEILISDEDFDNNKIIPVKYEGKVVIRVVNDYEEDDDDVEKEEEYEY